MHKMKKFDLVRLVYDMPYQKNNLEKDMRGIVIEEKFDYVSVLFFSPQNIGNFAVVNVDAKDVSLEKEKLPAEVQNEILANLDSVLSITKDHLEPVQIKEYDMVELIVEDSKYSKLGIHKGDRGCVMDAKAVQNYIEVDFSGINSKGVFYGDCISVKIEDLKVINK